MRHILLAVVAALAVVLGAVAGITTAASASTASHSARADTSDTITITYPVTYTDNTNITQVYSMVGDHISLQVRASSSAGLPLTYSATNLPPGLSITSSTGLISGTATTQSNVAVLLTVSNLTVSDASGARQSTFFYWNVNRVVYKRARSI
jgi:hypothetical protein